MVTNPNGTTATSTYDGSGRVTKIVYSDGTTPTVTYGYNSDGSVSQMTDGYGTTTYTYDGQGNLATESSPNGEMQYTWDPAGNLASVTYPDGNSVSYGYDSQGNMSSMTDSLGNSTTFKYDGDGNLTEADLPNGTVTSYAYDASSDLNKVSTTKSGTLQFSFDASGTNGIGPDGNVQSMTTSQQSNVGLRPGNGTAGNAGTDAYNYDPLQRLTADTQSGPSGTTSSSSMSYADNGELSSASGPTIHNGSYTYQGTTGHDAGKLQSIGSGLVFAYDAQGNRTCQGTASPCSSNTTYTYGYDANNRLTSWADTTSDSETFSYDGNGLLQQTLYKTPGSVCPSIPQGPGATPWRSAPSSPRRPRKHVSSGYCTDETNLVWNTALGSPTLAVTQEYATGVDEGHTDYLMGPEGLPVEQLDVSAGGGKGSGTPLYYYQDLQGNTRALEDSTGTVVNVQNYPPYGVATGSFGNTGWTPLQYDGTYTDGTTGFVYDQARWYDPSTGQFLSQDPLVSQTLQPYAYAQDSPTSRSDPSGLRARRFSTLRKREHYAYHWFKVVKHLEPHQSAAILGNLEVEDPCLLPALWQNGKCTNHNNGWYCPSGYKCGPGRGIAQWEDPGRWDDLVRFAGRKSPFSYAVQVNFIWHELTTDYNQALQMLRAQKWLYYATREFKRVYEGAAPDSTDLDKRVNHARHVCHRYEGKGSPKCR